MAKRKLSRQKMIDRMVRDDIGSIRRSLEKNDISFLDYVLRGEGWTPYNKLTDRQVSSEYRNRWDDIAEWEKVYDECYGKHRNKYPV